MHEGKLLRESVQVEGVLFETAPLAMDKEIDLLGLSGHNALVQMGMQDMTDDLVPSLALRDVYVQFPGDAPPVRFADMHINDSYFDRSVDGHNRLKGLVMYLKYTQTWGQYKLHWRVSVAGEVNLEMANIKMWGNTELQSAEPIGDAPAITPQQLRDMDSSLRGKVLGYSLTAYRGNRHY
ncbi:hypothetical protein [Xanthomonas phage RTH11]|nr:hypothetical protein [Xanthomonas phage RTH11]